MFGLSVILRAEYGGRPVAASIGRDHENHGPSFVRIIRCADAAASIIQSMHGRRRCSANDLMQYAVLTKETDMNWQTPKATDLRFGFEITMYIANR
jgi:coenzyme PQQ precursor peptide PqqA